MVGAISSRATDSIARPPDRKLIDWGCIAFNRDYERFSGARMAAPGGDIGALCLSLLPCYRSGVAQGHHGVAMLAVVALLELAHKTVIGRCEPTVAFER